MVGKRWIVSGLEDNFETLCSATNKSWNEVFCVWELSSGSSIFETSDFATDLSYKMSCQIVF